VAKPLDGVGVLDLSKVLAGPPCAQYLGGPGAEIIKAQAVGQGDETRGWPPFSRAGVRHGASECKPQQTNIAIESFGAGVAEWLAIDADSLRALNDRLRSLLKLVAWPSRFRASG
jgi:formyl-CoA transferase